MARCPFAVWKPLPENAFQPSIDPDQVILHSSVDAPGPTTLSDYFQSPGVDVESHFFVKLDGVIEQYLDTTVMADANSLGNVRAIAIESEDEGNPDTRPWSQAQMTSIIRLIDWICTTHPKVARELCTSWTTPGIGWHSQWGAPGPWTNVAGKTCPGAARIAQVPTIIEGIRKDEFDMATLAELKTIVDAAHSETRSWIKNQNTLIVQALTKEIRAVSDGRIPIEEIESACERAIRQVMGSLDAV